MKLDFQSNLSYTHSSETNFYGQFRRSSKIPRTNRGRKKSRSLIDIHLILTGKEPDGELDDDLSYEYYKLHKETQTALQIVLRTGQFEPGVYSTSTPYTRDWKLVTKSDPLF